MFIRFFMESVTKKRKRSTALRVQSSETSLCGHGTEKEGTVQGKTDGLILTETNWTFVSFPTSRRRERAASPDTRL